MSESLLKKDFKESDIQRVRNLVNKDYTSSTKAQSGYQKLYERYTEGDIWEEGRHPKDVMRSFTHEMIHHIQNLEGRLGKIQTSDTTSSDDLLEIEKEAYLKGSKNYKKRYVGQGK